MPAIREALTTAAARFTHSDTALLDAQVLLCGVLHCNTAHLLAWPERALDEEQASQFERLVQRRERGEPIAYIRGHQEFFSREFKVDEHTLIPRPETECMIEAVLERIDADADLDVIDLGTGSGAIAVTLACERPRWRVTATDVSLQALDIARSNAQIYDADITFLQQDWLTGDARYGLIISNPPYIRADDPHLAQGDVRFEPQLALASGADGLNAITAITSMAAEHLVAGGWLVLEHGYDQQHDVVDIMRSAGLSVVSQEADHAGIPRFTVARSVQREVG